MTLIIKQVVIRGEVVEDPSNSNKQDSLNYETVKELIETAKKEIEREYQDKINEMIGNSAIR